MSSEDMQQVPQQLLGLWLKLQHLNKRMENRFGLSLVQWHVLKKTMLLPGISAQSLANEVGIHPSTLTPLLRRLMEKGFVFLEEDPVDSRKRTIVISREGRNALLAMEGKLEAAVHRIGIKSDQVAGLRGDVDRLLMETV